MPAVEDGFVRIEMHDTDGLPVSDAPAPALWMLLPGGLIERGALAQQRNILASMALCRRNEFDRAVAMLMVVPLNEGSHPIPSATQTGKWPARIKRMVFQGFKERFRVRNM